MHTLNAYQMSMKANMTLGTIGAPLLTNAPPDQQAPQINQLTVTITQAPFKIIVSASVSNLTNNDTPVIGATGSRSPGSTTPPRSVPQIITEPAGTLGPWDITGAYLARYAQPPSFRKISIRVHYVRSTNGARSNSLAQLATVP